MSFLFSKDKRTPYEKAKDQTREISSQIRREKSQLDRQIAKSDQEILRLTNDIRKHARNNNKDALRTLAKGVVKLKHDKSNLYSAKAHLDTIDFAVKNQLTNVKIVGVMQKSSEIAQSLSELMKVEQMQGVSQQFCEELMKMGVMGEMITEAVDGALENNELEEEADEEVNNVLEEIIGGKVRQLPTVTGIQTPVKQNVTDSEDEEVAQRLQALRS